MLRLGPPNPKEVIWFQQERLQSLRKFPILAFMRRLGTFICFFIYQCSLIHLILALLNSQCVFYQLYNISKFWKWFCVVCYTYCNEGHSVPQTTLASHFGNHTHKKTKYNSTNISPIKRGSVTHSYGNVYWSHSETPFTTIRVVLNEENKTKKKITNVYKDVEKMETWFTADEDVKWMAETLWK